MTEDLAAPESPELLYVSWEERPSIARPIMQGDVFSGVTLPGLSDEPQLGQIIMRSAWVMLAGSRQAQRLAWLDEE